MDGAGHNLCCARSILTSDGVFSSDGSMLIGMGEGTARIGQKLGEISRFLLLKILIFNFGYLLSKKRSQIDVMQT